MRWRLERRSVPSSATDGPGDIRTPSSDAISVGMVALDPHHRRALVEGVCVHLPASEAALLMRLMRNAGRVLTTVELAQADGSYRADPARAVRRTRRCMRRLCRRLVVSPVTPVLIERVGPDSFRFVLI